MSSAWSVEQQRCLTALGYTLYRSAVLPASGAQTTAAIADVTETAIDPLLRALLCAAGFDPASRDRLQIDADDWMRKHRIPSLVQLRNDPAAKRALWPQLRASRRKRDPS